MSEVSAAAARAVAEVLRERAGATVEDLADAVIDLLVARDLLAANGHEWGVKISGDGDPQGFADAATAERFMAPHAGDTLCRRTAAGPWIEVSMSVPAMPRTSLEGIPLGWCPKCPSGVGLLTADGWKCDTCGATGHNPAGRPMQAG